MYSRTSRNAFQLKAKTIDTRIKSKGPVPLTVKIPELCSKAFNDFK